MKIKTEAQQKSDMLSCIIWAGIWLMMLVALLSQNACSNWQGAEFRIGVGSYNGANETRTYNAEKDVKEASKKY